ncbi:MAG: heat-inducible transcription repressor HrcA [Syntrophobacteraceae bacterium]|nr:heat-inducible transcription repressor HrcA [Syntrophobacteraceae bacterium]
MIELTKRDQAVLEAVVTDYIQTGEPVGSRTISKRYGLKVSPATIRNVMADLEEMGFLQQPHTSAGRVPTEKGLRFYLDTLVQFRALENQERALIREAFRGKEQDVKELLQITSQILSSFCRQAGVVLWPRLTMARLRHIEFIRLRPNQIMVILISKSGLVHHSVLVWEEDIPQNELDKYSRYVNELLEDVPLGDVKRRILEEMRKEKVLFDQLYTRALEITTRAFQANLEKSELFIEGQTNLLNNPEFADVDRLRRLLHAFEDKSRIIRLLDMTLKTSSGVRIILGTESELKELQEISLISSPYRRGDTLLGVLGVIGPVRMDYSRIIPVVEFTAGLLSQILEEPEEV